MQVTAIKKQLKNENRYSVFVDKRYCFSLSASALLDAKLAVGTILDTHQVTDYKKAAEKDALYGKALHYITIRPRSTWELETYLHRHKTPPPLSQHILNKLRNNKLLDDLSFATWWVENRRLLKPVSRRRLIAELHLKKIESSIIETVLRDDETNDQSVIQELITQKRRQTRYQDDLKLMQYLSRQGFSYEDIKTAMQKS